MKIIAIFKLVLTLGKNIYDFIEGLGWKPGDSLPKGPLHTISKANTKEKAEALKSENALLRQDQKVNHDARAQDIEKDISITNEDGDVVAVDLSRRG